MRIQSEVPTVSVQICFSLRYELTTPTGGLLSVVVLEAKNLPCLSSGECPGQSSISSVTYVHTDKFI